MANNPLARGLSVRVCPEAEDTIFGQKLPVVQPSPRAAAVNDAVKNADMKARRRSSSNVAQFRPSSNIKRTSVSVSPARRKNNARPVKIFVGSWNTEYGDFSYESMRPLKSLPNARAVRNHFPSLPNAIPVRGIRVGSHRQEAQQVRRRVKGSELLRPDLLDGSRTPDSRNCWDDDGDEEDDDLSGSDCCPSGGSEVAGLAGPGGAGPGGARATPGSKATPGGVNGSRANPGGAPPPGEPAQSEWTEVYRQTHPAPTKKRVIAEKEQVPRPPYAEPLSDWLPVGYDVYVISLQESTGDKLQEGILEYLNRSSGGRDFVKIKYTEDKISGLGDGAYLSLKSTAIACFVAVDLLGNEVEAGSSKKMSLSSINGSKGAVAIILTVYKQIFCFVSCHLPAGKPASRVKAREAIRKQLSAAYSPQSSNNSETYHVTQLFHHIIWTGDFNLRVHGLGAKQVLDRLYGNDQETVLAFDEFQFRDSCADFEADGYEELPICFWPTYKKIVGRPPADPSDPYCFHRCYNVHFKVRWYKGGGLKERVPSWTDRVFKWSNSQVQNQLYFIADSYKAADPPYDSLLLQSDHTPIGCGFLSFPIDEGPPAVLFQS